MDAVQQQTNSGSNIDSAKCQKLKRFVIVGLLITIGILSWHFYGELRVSLRSLLKEKAR